MLRMALRLAIPGLLARERRPVPCWPFTIIVRLLATNPHANKASQSLHKSSVVA